MTSCESTCETSYESCDVDLWHLVSHIARYRDSLALGGADAEGHLQKVMFAFERETCLSQDEIADLAKLVDADECDPEFLLYLSATLGTMVDGSWGEDFQRWFVKNLVSFYKIKGTHLSWDKQFVWLTGYLYKAWELWKRIPQEVGYYSRIQDYDHQLKSARFDLYTSYGGSDTFLTPAQARPIAEYVESLRPIHVLLRRDIIRVRSTETARVSENVLNSEFLGTFTESHEITDTFEPGYRCVSLCETSDQTPGPGCGGQTIDFDCTTDCLSVWKTPGCRN